MNEMNFTPSELLIAYVDGELEQLQEPSLFQALNESSELRTEMRDLLAMRRAIKDDRVAFTPPLAATAAVFGTLGFSAPAIIGSSWWSALWSKAGLAVAGVLLGSAVTWFGMNTTSSDKESASTAVMPQQQNTAQSTTAQNTAQSTSVQSPVSEQHQPATFATEQPAVQPTQQAQASNTKTIVQTRVVTKYVYVPVADAEKISSLNNSSVTSNNNSTNSGTNGTGSNLTQNANQTQSDSSPERLADKPKDIVLEQSNQPKVLPTFSPFMVHNFSNGITNLTPDVATIAPEREGEYIKPEVYPKVVFQLRGLSGTSFVDVPVEPEGGLGFNNMAVSPFMYLLNSSFGAGIEFGREPYALKFQGKETLNGQTRTLRYESYPTVFWGTAFLQYRIPINEKVQCFAQPSVGGASYGLMGRLLFGIQYSPISSLRLMGGFEVSNMWYDYQETRYSSFKGGLTYGISYQF